MIFSENSLLQKVVLIVSAGLNIVSIFSFLSGRISFPYMLFLLYGTVYGTKSIWGLKKVNEKNTILRDPVRADWHLRFAVGGFLLLFLLFYWCVLIFDNPFLKAAEFFDEDRAFLLVAALVGVTYMVFMYLADQQPIHLEEKGFQIWANPILVPYSSIRELEIPEGRHDTLIIRFDGEHPVRKRSSFSFSEADGWEHTLRGLVDAKRAKKKLRLRMRD